MDKAIEAAIVFVALCLEPFRREDGNFSKFKIALFIGRAALIAFVAITVSQWFSSPKPADSLAQQRDDSFNRCLGKLSLVNPPSIEACRIAAVTFYPEVTPHATLPPAK